jgi:hypothetical protein
MTSARIGLLVVLVGFATGTPRTEAAPRTAMNRCSDAMKILRSGSMHFKDSEVRAGNVKNAIAHFNQVAENWRRATEQINQIPKAELNWSDPALAECKQELDMWLAYINSLKARIEAAQGAAAEERPFFDNVKGLDDSLLVLAAVEIDPKSDGMANLKAEATHKIMEDLATVEKACRGAGYPGDRLKDPGRQPGGSERRIGQVSISSAWLRIPENWCYIAMHRNDLMARALGNRPFFVAGYGNWTIVVPDVIKSLHAGGDGYMDSWVAQLVVDPSEFKALMKKEAADWYKHAGVAMPAEPFVLLDTLIRDLQAQVGATAPGFQFPSSGPHDKGLEKMAKAGVAKIYGGVKVIKTMMDADGFTVTKNTRGVPLNRFRSGSVLFKLKDAKWCSQRTFSYVEEHIGGGKYQKQKTVTVLPSMRFVSCASP